MNAHSIPHLSNPGYRRVCTNAPAFEVRAGDNLLALDQMEVGLAPGDSSAAAS